MQRLWAPWRMDYIRGPKDNDCFLCRIFRSRQDRKHLLLKRGETCAIVMNRYPYNNGHLMVCPYRHIAGIGRMTAAEKLESMELVSEAIEALKKKVRPHGFNVGINLGTAAGAGLKEHVHTHVVPRWNGDTNYMSVLTDVKVIPQSLLELWDELHPVLNG
jgi:ATP adenylyltransferase